MEETLEVAGAGKSQDRFWQGAALWFIEQPLDEAITRLLAALAKRHQADRAWVMRYNEDLSCLSNSHEWAREGVGEFVDDLQNVPATMMGSLHEGMLRNEVVSFDVAKMPAELPLLAAEFRRQNNRAVLCLPLWNEGRLVGMFGYDAVRSRKEWPRVAIRMLRAAGKLADRFASRTSPPCQASLRLGLPADFLYRSQAEQRRLLERRSDILATA